MSVLFTNLSDTFPKLFQSYNLNTYKLAHKQVGYFPIVKTYSIYNARSVKISTCYSGPTLCSTMANSSHMQPIFCLCDPRCLDMVSLTEIKAAFDNGCSGGGTAPT